MNCQQIRRRASEFSATVVAVLPRCRRRRTGWGLILAAALVPAVPAAPLGAQEPSTKVDDAFFESRIRPVLVTHCYKCHSSSVAAPKGGLRVDSRDALLKGGESGQVIVPGHPEDSALLQALRYETYEMPPEGQLSEQVLADVELWIAQGAPDPREGEDAARPRKIDLAEGKTYWAFQPVRPAPLPNVQQADWPLRDLDVFVLARQESAGLKPNADADPATLLRRVSLDLVGLPPTPPQLENFLRDPSPARYARVVDQLLDSPEFGERWGRHWLDAARYAESMGKTRNVPFPDAWKFRDYVIDAWNRDLPYDQFILEQLAGDLLESRDADQRERRLIATGFLAVGSHDLNERDRHAYVMQVVAEQIDTTTRALLGMTVGCARCHDHKFDPIPITDYYALAGIFLSTQTMNGYTNRALGDYQLRGDLLISLDPAQVSMADRRLVADPASVQLPTEVQQRVDAGRQQVATLQNRLARLQQQPGTPIGRNTDRQSRLDRLTQTISQRQQQLERAVRRAMERQEAEAPPAPVTGPVCMGARDADRILDCPVHLGGEPHELGAVVPRGYLSVIDVPKTRRPARDSSGRLELAQWIASPHNPLTARVFVNRVWAHLFGRGIVASLDNFGQTGERPSHPEVLDRLAHDFVEQRWSTKQLIRTIVTSHTYRLASTMQAGNQEKDPANILLWRMNRKRLEFEAIRDSLLAVAGQLNLNPPTGPPVQRMSFRQLRGREGMSLDGTTFPGRSIYLPVLRNRIPEAMTNFDFPDPSETWGQREVTTVPTQALFFLNDPLVMQAAAALGRKFDQQSFTDAASIEQAYRSVLGRPASDRERQRAQSFLAESTARQSTPAGAWALFFQALLASAEFRYCL